LENATIEGVDRLEENLIGENTKIIGREEGNAIKVHIRDYLN